MFLLILALTSTPAIAAEPAVSTAPDARSARPPLTLLSGEAVAPETLEGKVLLFVNVASRCGYTPQYEGLQELFSDYEDRGLVVVGVPCNQFGGQEPGDAEAIASFCKMNYGVAFPLLNKQEVNGDNRSPLYTWLVDSEVGGGETIGWNFEKFLVDRSGAVIGRYPSKVAPDDPALISALEAALTK